MKTTKKSKQTKILNFVAKYMGFVCKPAVHADKKDYKRNDKHKKDYKFND